MACKSVYKESFVTRLYQKRRTYSFLGGISITLFEFLLSWELNSDMPLGKQFFFHYLATSQLVLALCIAVVIKTHKLNSLIEGMNCYLYFIFPPILENPRSFFLIIIIVTSSYCSKNGKLLFSASYSLTFLNILQSVVLLQINKAVVL